MLQHRKSLQFTRQAVLLFSRHQQQRLFLSTTSYVSGFVMNMQCDFCKLGTAAILEYHLDEFQAFFIFVRKILCRSLSVGRNLFSQTRCALSRRPERQRHRNWTYLICLPLNAVFLVVCVICVSDMCVCVLTDLVSNFLRQ